MKKIVTIFLLAIVALLWSGCGGDTDPATNITATSATLNGTVNCSTGDSGEVYYRYRKVGTTPWSETNHDSFNCGSNSGDRDWPRNVTNLTPDTQYEFEVTATMTNPNYGIVSANSNGQGGKPDAPGPLDTFRTLTSVPPSDCYQVESQSWWTPEADPLPFPGDMQHIHAGACFPYKQVLTGNSYTLPVTVKMHNESGKYLNYVRIDDVTDQDGDIRFFVTRHDLCQSADCTYTVNVTVNLDSLSTGMHEWRVGASSSDIDTNADTFNRNLATSGWQVCVRSCSGVTPQNNRFEMRGWYMNEQTTAFHEGYDVVSWDGPDSEFPWDISTRTYRPISGVWNPPLDLHLGAHDLAQTIDRSRCYVDPDFHHGSAGTQVLNVSGPFRGRLNIDTTQFINGLHKLVCTTGTDEEGHLDGVGSFTFLVAN